MAVNPCSNQLKIHLISIWERKCNHCHFKKSRSGSGSGSEHAFVQLAQKLLLSPASPSTAIHATQLCLYSPSEQGSALLLTCLAAPPARPYPFHGHSTVELLENTGNMLLYPFSIQFPAIYDNFIFFSACKISQYVFLLCNSRHYIPFRSEHIIPVCKPLGFFLVQCP